jgi:hypothetical protein
MAALLPLTEWAQQMADAVQHAALAKEQQQARRGQESRDESLWAKGIDQVVQTLGGLVQALRQTQHFPHLRLISYAQSPQGATTYMRRGTLLSLRGLREEGGTLEFEIDSSPTFRADLLVPLVRVLTTPPTQQAVGLRKAHWCVGISEDGAVAWHRLNPALAISPEGSTEEILRQFLEVLLLTE